MNWKLAEGNNREVWNSFLKNAGGSFLQSWEWGEIQKKLGKGIKRYTIQDEHTGEIQFLAAGIEQLLPLGFSYVYFPRGPVGHSIEEERFKVFLDLARREASCRKKVIFLRIEPGRASRELPKKNLERIGLSGVNPVQPGQTIIIKLGAAESTIMDGIDHDARYAIRAAERRGVRVTVDGELTQNFEKFWGLLQNTALQNKFTTYPRAYYERILAERGDLGAAIVSGKVNGETIAAALIVFFNETATYLFAASKPGFGRFNAPSLVLWEAIREAKKRDCSFFDLWGISDTRGSWRGFTAFKRSFGGEEVHSAGTWDLPLRANFYRGYRFAKKFL